MAGVVAGRIGNTELFNLIETTRQYPVSISDTGVRGG